LLTQKVSRPFNKSSFGKIQKIARALPCVCVKLNAGIDNADPGFEMELVFVKSISLRTALASLALLAASALFPSVSQADTYFLTSDHCKPLCGPQSTFGEVDVTNAGTDTVDVQVTLFNGNRFTNTGLPLSFAFFLDQSITSVTYSAVVGSTTGQGWSPATGDTQFAGNYGVDGFKDFNYGLVWVGNGGQGSSNPGGSSLFFEITGAGLSTASFLLSQNLGSGNGGDAAFFVADIISNNGNTGPVDASVRAVPGPISGAGLSGLIAACLGLFGLHRRRKNSFVA
jgi:hypothetical protein